MAADAHHSKSRNLVIPTLLVVVLAFTSALLLLSGFVIWFAELIDSITFALFICGALLAAAAWATYRLSLSPTLKRIEREYQEIITIINALRNIYQCAIERIKKILTII